MPVFDYQCEECKTKYDVYHKVREVVDDVACPSCGSKSHKRLMSVPGAPVTGNAAGNYRTEPSCESGCCSGGMCGMN